MVPNNVRPSPSIDGARPFRRISERSIAGSCPPLRSQAWTELVRSIVMAAALVIDFKPS